MTARSRSRWTAGLAAASLALGLFVTSAAPASAAPGDPFDPGRPTIFFGTGAGATTQLSIVREGESGVSITEQGAPAPVDYNGFDFNPADGYLYGFSGTASDDIPAGSLVRVGQDGVVTLVSAESSPGTPWGGLNLGAFGPDGRLYASDVSGDEIFVISIDGGTATLDETLDVDLPVNFLESTGRVSDYTAADGFLWGLGDGETGPTIYRFDLSGTGDVAVDSWQLPAAGGIANTFAGGAWTYANGDLGFFQNEAARIARIAVSDPAAADPGFEIVSTQATGQQAPVARVDAGSIPGLPADLAIEKSSSGFAAGETVTYTLQVTNEGAGWAEDWIVADEVPAPLTDVEVTSDDADCDVEGNVVVCVGGELAPGPNDDGVPTGGTVTITAAVPAGFEGEIENVATVDSTTVDPEPANNIDGVVDSTLVEVVTPPADLPDSEFVSAPAGGSGGGSMLPLAIAGSLALLAAGVARRLTRA